MSSKKSTSFAQLGIQVGEKLIHGFIKAAIQCVKWLWQAGNWFHAQYLALRGHSVMKPVHALERVAAAVVIFVLMLLLVRRLIF